MSIHRLALLSIGFMVASPIAGFAAEQIIPAGSLIQCMISEPKLSSKTTDIGDPVLCRVTHVDSYGRSLPYGTVLVGRFEDYKDPGHLVGKGWMELKFERMVVRDEVVPLEAKVVNVPGYNVDRVGRILGKGHPVRDVVEWSIPILWPIDLLNLPRRGPRPVLKSETRLTLKVMDDIGVPERPTEMMPGGLQQRAPVSYAAPPAVLPMQRTYAAPAMPPPVLQAYAPPHVYVPYGYGYPGPYAAAPGYPVSPWAAGVRGPVVVMRNGVPYRVIVR